MFENGIGRMHIRQVLFLIVIFYFTLIEINFIKNIIII